MAKRTAVCESCGITYTKTGQRQKYCSRHCLYKHQTAEDGMFKFRVGICVTCGATFSKPDRRHDKQIYCGKKCNGRAFFEQTNPEYRRGRETYRRAWVLKTRYGLDAMPDVTACELCGREGELNQKGGKGLVIDHDHDTGTYRGVLCFKCNVGIGFLGDSVEGVERAVAYLRRTRDGTS